MSDSADRLVCNSCQHAIRTQEDRLTHYKSEWHRYNVKRRCAGLPPLSLPQFTQQLATLQQRRDAATQAVGGVKVRVKCDVCGKVFASKASYDSHLLSKKHIKMTEQQKSGEAVADEAEEDEEDEAAESDEWELVDERKAIETDTQPLEEKQAPTLSPATAVDSSLASATSQLSLSPSSKPSPPPIDDEKSTPMEYDGYTLQPGESPIPLLHCLFCSHTFTTVPDSTSHMHRQHGFFIPFPKQLASVDGLLTYLGEKVGIGHCCVYCSARYGSTSAVKQHMNSLSHCKIRLDTEEDEDEYSDFYDFTVSDKDGGGEGEGGEARSGRRLVGMTDGGELLMTDGSTIGHRQYQRVYQQNIRVREEEEEEGEETPSTIEAGAGEEAGTAVVATDMKGGALVLQGGEKQSGKRYRETWVRKNERRLALKVGLRNNLQKHYRAQVLF